MKLSPSLKSGEEKSPTSSQLNGQESACLPAVPSPPTVSNSSRFKKEGGRKEGRKVPRHTTTDGHPRHAKVGAADNGRKREERKAVLTTRLHLYQVQRERHLPCREFQDICKNYSSTSEQPQKYTVNPLIFTILGATLQTNGPTLTSEHTAE